MKMRIIVVDPNHYEMTDRRRGNHFNDQKGFTVSQETKDMNLGIDKKD